jgi:branched-chain amino acid transport system permease protein
MIGQLIIEGLSTGACYGLFAIAFVIIYKTSDVINFGQAEMAMFCTYFMYQILDVYHLPFWASFFITLGFAALLGIALHYFFLRPAKNSSTIGLIGITLGIEMVLMGLAGWKWGAEQKEFALPLSCSTTRTIPGNLVISDWAIAVFATTAIIMIFLYAFFKYTKPGIAMRAIQQNMHAARIVGVSTGAIFSLAWGMSSVIGTVAAMLFAAVSTLDPHFMMAPFVRAFAAAVLGGLKSIPGVIAGGLILGLTETLFGYMWPRWKPIVALIVIVCVLYFRPSGLFTRQYIKKM